MYQKLVLVGNLGNDPELRYMPDGKGVCNFSLAVNNRDETTWFRITVWGRQAETAHEYLTKGRTVLVEGRLRGDERGGPRIWTGQDGTARANFEVTADSVRFIGGRTDNGHGDDAEAEGVPF